MCEMEDNRGMNSYADYWVMCPVCRRRVSLQAHPLGDKCPACRSMIGEREVLALAFSGQTVRTSGRSMAADLSYIRK